MKKISLLSYKNISTYLEVYDTIIKKEYNNKDKFLKSIGISPSSYRRAKNSENKVLTKIVKTLNDCFNYNSIDNEELKYLENKINQIYFNIYYKKNENLNNDYEVLVQLLNKKYIIFPIILLFKLLIELTSLANPDSTLAKNKELFLYISEFKRFFNNDLMEIYEIVEVLYIEKLDSSCITKKYKNELCYDTLATRCLLEHKYIEAMYMLEKVKKEFINEENYVRVYYTNLKFMLLYNSLGWYEDSYLLSSKQLLTLESVEKLDRLYDLTKRHYLVSCLSLNKYEEIIQFLKQFNKYSKIEVTCYLYSLYNEDINNYESEYLTQLKVNIDNRQFIEYLKLVNDYLKLNDDKLVKYLKNGKFYEPLVNFLEKNKKNFFECSVLNKKI